MGLPRVQVMAAAHPGKDLCVFNHLYILQGVSRAISTLPLCRRCITSRFSREREKPFASMLKFLAKVHENIFEKALVSSPHPVQQYTRSLYLLPEVRLGVGSRRDKKSTWREESAHFSRFQPLVSELYSGTRPLRSYQGSRTAEVTSYFTPAK